MSCCCSSSEVVAQSCHTPAAPAAKPNKMAIPDVKVLDQEGGTLNFYTDLIKDKTVAINFIFTNCTTICAAGRDLRAPAKRWAT